MATSFLNALDGEVARPEPRRRDGLDCAIDLVHLSRQTLGDRALESELLRLFERQCEHILARLDRARAGDRRQRGDLAHTLNGSARAVGAGAVAGAAERYEQALGGEADERGVEEALAALRGASEEARRHVLRLLADA